jgi:hypothetical protein
VIVLTVKVKVPSYLCAVGTVYIERDSRDACIATTYNPDENSTEFADIDQRNSDHWYLNLMFDLREGHLHSWASTNRQSTLKPVNASYFTFRQVFSRSLPFLSS